MERMCRNVLADTEEGIDACTETEMAIELPALRLLLRALLVSGGYSVDATQRTQSSWSEAQLAEAAAKLIRMPGGKQLRIPAGTLPANPKAMRAAKPRRLASPMHSATSPQ